MKTEDWKEIGLNSVPRTFQKWLKNIGYEGVIRHLDDGRFMVGLVFTHCIYNVQFAEHHLVAVTQIAHDHTSPEVEAKLGDLIYKADRIDGPRQFSEAMAKISEAEMKICDAAPWN